MASTTPEGGLLASVQRQLAQGRSDEEILAGLTASGLSLASASRFLERARPAAAAPAVAVPPLLPTAPPPLPSLALPPPLPGEAVPAIPLEVAAGAPPTAATAERSEPTGSWVGVVGGAVVLTLGLVLLAWALSRERGVRIRLPLVIVVAGAGWMLQSARQSIDRRRPATWVLPGVSAVPPALAFVGVLGTFVMTRDREPARLETAASAPDPHVTARRVVAPPSREDTIALKVDTLEGRRKGDACAAADDLASLDAREHVPTLENALSSAGADMDKTCIAYALVRLGDTDAMLAQYLEWSQAESDTLRHDAVVGFGHIGPAAAPQALPVLEHILAGTTTAAQRAVVARTLAKLGPSARPLLRPLAIDEDPQVRTIAQRILEESR